MGFLKRLGNKIGSRRLIGYPCLVAALLFVILLVYSFFSTDTGYLFRLFVWFFLCLAAFHSWYAFSNLSEAQVRAIDYFYLGIAAVAVFVLAANYSDQRVKIGVAKEIKDYKSSVSSMQAAVQFYFLVSCNRKVTNLVPALCDNTEKLIVLFEGIPSSGAIEKAGNDLKAVALPADIADDFVKGVLEDATPHLLSLLSDLEKQAKAVETLQAAPKETRIDEQIEKHLGPRMFGEAVLWPFILALALALRITKVTIEIFKWWKDAPMERLVSN